MTENENEITGEEMPAYMQPILQRLFESLEPGEWYPFEGMVKRGEEGIIYMGNLTAYEPGNDPGAQTRSLLELLRPMLWDLFAEYWKEAMTIKSEPSLDEARIKLCITTRARKVMIEMATAIKTLDENMRPAPTSPVPRTHVNGG